jgi:hypothetical protein
LESLISNLNCGRINIRKYKDSSRGTCVDFMVTNISDIHQVIIPFFNEYKILGVKLQDFKD